MMRLQNNNPPVEEPVYQDELTGAPEISGLVYAILERRIGDGPDETQN